MRRHRKIQLSKTAGKQNNGAGNIMPGTEIKAAQKSRTMKIAQGSSAVKSEGT